MGAGRTTRAALRNSLAGATATIQAPGHGTRAAEHKCDPPKGPGVGRPGASPGPSTARRPPWRQRPQLCALLSDSRLQRRREGSFTTKRALNFLLVGEATLGGGERGKSQSWDLWKQNRNALKHSHPVPELPPGAPRRAMPGSSD